MMVLGKINSIYLRTFQQVYIFCYHRIIPETIAKSQMVHRALYITPETFESHIRWMIKHGQITTTSDLYHVSRFPRFIITFDDGWKDNVTYAVPILKKYHCSAEFYLSTGNIDSRELFWSENIGFLINDALKKHTTEVVATRLSNLVKALITCYGLQEKIDVDSSSENLVYLIDRYIETVKYIPIADRDEVLLRLCQELNIVFHNDGDKLLLDWQEIASMSRSGFRFGTHTHSHTLLDRVDNETIDSELEQSKIVLEKILGVEVDSFSYPNGYYQNPYIQSSLRKHGYRYAYTLGSKPFKSKRDDRYHIPRFLVFEDISRSMDRCFVSYILRDSIKSIITAAIKSMNMDPEPNQHRIRINNRRFNK